MNTSIIYGFFIFLFIAILFGLYFFYKVKTTNVNKYGMMLLEGPIKLKEDFQQVLQVSSLVGTRNTLYVPYLGYGLSFTFEMYISGSNSNSEWRSSFNKLKPIIKMIDSPVISYQPKKNYLSIVLKYRDNPFLAKFAEIQYKNLKLQTWIKYIIVISSNNVRIYENGNLVKSKTLDAVPILYDYDSKIMLGQKNNNCLCKVRNMYMYPYPLASTEISSV
jgi:hypothetical protein